jgi:hypothetical protein
VHGLLEGHGKSDPWEPILFQPYLSLEFTGIRSYPCDAMTPDYTGLAMRVFQVVSIGVVLAAAALAVIHHQELANFLVPLLHSIR